MAEQVIFGKTDKRLNSISQRYTPIITTNVLLKEPCSIVAPTFLVKQPYATMRECNYCEYAGYYYFITNVVSVRNKHVLVQCARDPLASFRDDILNHEIYANYADKKNWDDRLDDVRMMTDLTQEGAVESSVISFTTEDPGDDHSNIPLFDKAGTVILSSYVSDNGFVQWAISLETFAEVIREVYKNILEEIGSGSVGDAWQKFAIKYFGGASINDAILSAVWVPFSIELYQGSYESNILLGSYVTDVSGLALAPTGLHVAMRQSKVELPGASSGILADHAWLRHPAYTTVQFIHPNGVTDISCPEMVKNPEYTMTLVINKTTGDYAVNVSCTPDADNEFTVTIVSGNVSCDLTHLITTQGLSINDIGMNVVKAGVTAFANIYSSYNGSVTTTSFTDNSISEVIKDGSDGSSISTRQGNGSVTTSKTTSSSSAQLASGIAGMLPSARPHSTSGSVQCSSNILLAFRDKDSDLSDAFRVNVESSFPRVIIDNKYDEFCSLQGYPCKKMVKLSSLESCLVQGFCASIGAEGATTTELSTINSTLNSGMYIED